MRVAKKITALSRLFTFLFEQVAIFKPFDLSPGKDGCEIKLTSANGIPLPHGRYLLCVSRHARTRLPALDVEVSLAERKVTFMVESGERRTYIPIVLMSDTPCVVLTSKSDTQVLLEMNWHLRRMGYVAFYGFLLMRAALRLLRQKESGRLFLNAVLLNGINGFGDAVRGDWKGALAVPRSGFTDRSSSYTKIIGLPARPVARIPGLAIIGDYSAVAELPTIDQTLLQRAKVAGLTALCLPCKWERGELRLSAAVRHFLDHPDLNFPFLLCCVDAPPETVNQGEEDAFAKALSFWFGDPRYFRVEGRPVMAIPSSEHRPTAQAKTVVWRAARLIAEKVFIVTAISSKSLPRGSLEYDGLGVSVSVDDDRYDTKRTAASPGAGSADTLPALFGRLMYSAMSMEQVPPSGMSFVFVDLRSVDGGGPRLTEDEDYGDAWIESLRVAQARRAAFATGSGTSPRAAIAIHAFYPELLRELLEEKYLKSTHKLFVTTVEEHKEEVEGMLRVSGADYALRVFENRGRDVLPFMKIYEEIVAEGFDIVAKIHTKKSGHRRDGDVWRRSLIDPILDGVRFARILEAFERDESLGMTGPRMHLTSLKNNIVENEARVFGLARRLGLMNKDVRKGKFFAGSMFVARVSALAPLMSLAIDDENFEPEAGQLDGTMAHAVERGFALSVISCGMRLAALEEVTRKRRAFWWTPAQ